jgi:hypothetical protein
MIAALGLAQPIVDRELVEYGNNGCRSFQFGLLWSALNICSLEKERDLDLMVQKL